MDDIRREIETLLPHELVDIIRAAGRIAGSGGQTLYLVGGAVRDLLLRRPNQDIDLVLEGDAPALARRVAKRLDARVVTHPRFGTATISQGEIELDIVTARSETYSEPGALPTVTPGSIEADLFRRDFTINAMAAVLTPSRFGDLVDPYGGRSDLEAGLIRVLHAKSFEDDPTRIWRALRYEQRLDFRLEPGTEELARRNIPMLDRVSGDRLRHELERILDEERPEKALGRADDLGALQRLAPSLRGDAWLAERFDAARRRSARAKPQAGVYLALLAWRLDEEELQAFVKRLNFGREAARVLADVPRLKKALPSLEAEEEMPPSAVCRALEHHRPQAILAAALAADSEKLRHRLDLYLSELRLVTPSLDGEDLKRMGVAPGRKLGWLLKALKEARLDGRVSTRREEQDLVRQWLIDSRR